jgi:hypothetical protein
MTTDEAGLEARVGDAGGRAVAFRGGQLTLLVERAFAPGQPMHLTLLVGDDALALEGRSLGSRRTSDGLFRVELRLVNLRRDMRARLESLLGVAGR